MEYAGETYAGEAYDVIIIGAGHAGIEAGLAAARLGCKTGVFTINLDSVGNLPCNPSIGGTAKGHLVFEIDALGGEMGKAADHAAIQSRMLGRGKGPAVHSLRVQVDRRRYQEYMKHRLERQENLYLKQAEITELRQNGKNWECVTSLRARHSARCVVLASGTYLGGRIFVGDVSYEGGPDGLFAAARLTESLKALGIALRRFKTGTPARVLKSSVNTDVLERQDGDEPPAAFSREARTSGEIATNKACCYVTWTNDRTKEIIRENIHRSPLYAGRIEGIGPRYCPSIEDKIMRFADKERHQCFVEPCGLTTEEMYLQGMSSSLPEDVQIALYRTMPGLERAHIMRPAYAIEYDCADPTELCPTLEFRDLPGLFGAGQFNGSSGYEEAAAQGLVAGINAARLAGGKDMVTLSRSGSYIGTLIDDMVTKGVDDPYRMMTSRSEYRLLLRQDNADERLTGLGHEIGLVSDEEYAGFEHRKSLKEAEIRRARSTTIPASDKLNEVIVSRETEPLSGGVRLAELLKRPGISYSDLTEIDVTRPDLPGEIFERAEIEIKYEGYIRRQERAVAESARLENRALPPDLDYNQVIGLRLEAAEKLSKQRPASVGQASRMSGVSPADISVLLIWLSKLRTGEKHD